MKSAFCRCLPVIALAAALPALAQTPTMDKQPVQRELIYCADLMTHAEREAYRANMQAATTPTARDTLRADHRRVMQERANSMGRPGQCDAPLRLRAGQGFQGGTAK